MAAARKTPKKNSPPKTSAKHKGAKQKRIAVPLSPPMTVSSLGLPSGPLGFLIVGIGASAGGLEAMEEMKGPEGEGARRDG